VLGHDECATDPVPIPGEPCRSDDDLNAPSRLRDDFRLDLLPAGTPAQQAALPAQPEEVAVRALVRWLRSLPARRSGASAVRDLEAALRTAAGVTPGGPCPAASAIFTGPPPAGLSLPAGDAADHLRAALRLWATELLPCWRLAEGSGIPVSTDPADQPDVLRLASVRLDLTHDPTDDSFAVGPAGAVVTGAEAPFLVSQRLLQEWAVTAPLLPSTVQTVLVAAGRLDPDGAAPAAPFFSRGGLFGTRRGAEPDVLDLSFDGFHAPADYLVTGLPIVGPTGDVETLELAPPGPGGRPAVRIRRAVAGGAGQLLGIQLEVREVQP
jgi:hypothetical protein